MKRFLWSFLVLVFLVSLLTSLLIGCSGVVPPPPEEEPPLDLNLIREYVYFKGNLNRWPDGIVSVVDETNRTEFVWKEIWSV